MVISLRRYRRPVLVAVILLLMSTAVFGVCRHKLEKESGQAFEEYDEATVEAFLTAIDNFTQGSDDMELFDIGKGQVVKKYGLTQEIQNTVIKYLDDISGMYTKVKAFPEKGQILKIRLEPETEIVNKWLNSYGIFFVNNMFIIYPEEGTPYILVLDSNNRPLFFNFEAANKYELLNKLAGEQ